MKKLILALAAAGLLGAASWAQACSLTAWSNSSGSVVAGGIELPQAPNAEPNIPKFNGLCSMRVNGTGHVEDNSPADEPTIIIRFYFYALGSGNADLLVGYSSNGGAGTQLFTISYNGTNVSLTAGNTASAAAKAGWNSVTAQVTPGGAMNLWVNSDAAANPGSPDATATSTIAGLVNSIQLGAINGLGGLTAVYFDDYISQRSQLIAELIGGNANGDGVFDINDPVALLQQLVFISLAAGNPDADENGVEDINDAVCMLQNLVFLPSCLD